MSNLEKNSYLRIIQNLVKIEKIIPEQDKFSFEFVTRKIIDFSINHARSFMFYKAFSENLNKEIIKVLCVDIDRNIEGFGKFSNSKTVYYFGSIDDFTNIKQNKIFESLNDLYRSI